MILKKDYKNLLQCWRIKITCKVALEPRYLGDHKFRYNLEDCVCLMCTCHLDIEATNHTLLYYQSHHYASKRCQLKIVWHSKKHQKCKIDDIFSKNDDRTLKFYHYQYTTITNDSSSLNFLNEPIWWLEVSIYVFSPSVSHHSQHLSISYFSNIILQKIDYLRS